MVSKKVVFFRKEDNIVEIYIFMYFPFAELFGQFSFSLSLRVVCSLIQDFSKSNNVYFMCLGIF